MVLVSTAITETLRRLGVIAEDETASAAQSATAFATLNVLNDSWGAERLMPPYILRTVKAITANQASYTVGSGGNVNMVRPVFISHINYIDTSNSSLELPLMLWTDDQYAAQPLKALTSSLPTAAYYNPTYASGMGTLIPWPIPTSTTLQWIIYSPVAVPQFAATSDTLLLPPGYHRFIILSLAFDLAPIYGVSKEVRDGVEKDLRKATILIKQANYRTSDLFVPSINNNRTGIGYDAFISGQF